MEKFVLWFGLHSKDDFSPAVKILNRNSQESSFFLQFDFVSLLTFQLPCDTIKKITKGPLIVIQIGDFVPEEGWDVLLDSYSEEIDVLSKMKGDGLAFIVNTDKKEVDLIIEAWGRRIVYYSQSDSPIIISNELKGILSLERFMCSMDNIDEVSLAQLIGFHQCFGIRTIFKTIKLFPSGIIARIRKTNPCPEILRNYKYFEEYKEVEDVEKLTRNLSNSFREIMDQGIQNKTFTSLFLSGGRDSGLLLAGLSDGLRENIRCVNFGNKRATDVIRARKIVELIGGTYCFYDLKPCHVQGNNTFYHIWLVEGQSPSTVCFVEGVAARETGNIVCGNPGDFNLGGSWSDKLKCYSGKKGNFQEMVRKMTWKPEYFNILLGRKKGEKYMNFIEKSVVDSINREKSKNLKVALERFVLNNRVKRHANFGSWVVRETRILKEPYFQDKIISLTLSIPIQIRSERKLQSDIISHLSPQTVQLQWLQPTSNRMGLKSFIFELAKRIPVVRQIGSSLIARKVASSFEDNYVPINTWLREEESYREFVEELLFSSRTKNRGIFNQSGVLKLYKDHLAGKANHMLKLLNVIDLEIFFRLFCDGDGFKTPPKHIQNIDPPEVTEFPAPKQG